MGVGVLDDLTGQRFGRWAVIKRAPNARGGATRWVCECDCGAVRIVQAGNLKSGGSASCGCLKKERNKKRSKYYGKTCSELGCSEQILSRHLCRGHYEWLRSIERYGISREEFEDLLEGQGHACLVCREPFTEARRPSIDHDHACCDGRYRCGQCVRGILCTYCNAGLGQFNDDVALLHSAISYLEAA